MEFCDKCNNGNGVSIYPYYAVAPHNWPYKVGKDIGESAFLAQQSLPKNFTGDEETVINGNFGYGVYTHCLNCGAGSPAR